MPHKHLGEHVTYSWQLPVGAAWRDDALCGRMDPALWDPDRATDEQIAQGLAVCLDCPVRGECIEDAFTMHEVATIRGGVYFGDGAAPIGSTHAYPARRGRFGDASLYQRRKKIDCPTCGAFVTRGKNGRIFQHRNRRKEEFEWCEMGGEEFRGESA